LVRLAVRAYRADLQKPAAILSHLRHDAKATAKLKDIPRADPMEGNESAHGRQAGAKMVAAANGTLIAVSTFWPEDGSSGHKSRRSNPGQGRYRARSG
jgi:hypothetical protein